MPSLGAISSTPSSSQASGSWLSLPRKDQLAVLAAVRFADFFQISSFQAICYYQLKAFDPSLSEDILSWQAGVAQASFTAVQSFTAIAWGYVADARWGGRKAVLVAGLVGTGVSCVGWAATASFAGLVAARALGGALNGTVTAVRTMISEVIQEKRHQARAFLLLPASLSMAMIAGPVCAGWLADPAVKYPAQLGSFRWLQDHPYALPGLVSAGVLFAVLTLVLFILDETHKDLYSRRVIVGFAYKFSRRIFEFGHRHQKRMPLDSMGKEDEETLLTSVNEKTILKSELVDEKYADQQITQKLSFWRMWTVNVLLTLSTQAMFEFHLGAFSAIWPLLLASPRASGSESIGFSLALKGGLGMEPTNVGYAMAIMGVTGICIQLLLYPVIHSRLGTLRCYRVFSSWFPVVYAAIPFLVAVPADRLGNTTAMGWICITAVLCLHVTARVFSMSASIMLINNCSPHSSVLGTVHSAGQATAAASRTIGPIAAGCLYSLGYSHGSIELSWWSLAAISLMGWIVSLFIREGSGHEVVLPQEGGEQDDL